MRKVKVIAVHDDKEVVNIHELGAHDQPPEPGTQVWMRMPEGGFRLLQVDRTEEIPEQ